LECRGEYVAPKTITVASSTTEQVVLALAGGDVLYFEVDASSSSLKQVRFL
jgi:hypothetical protein